MEQILNAFPELSNAQIQQFEQLKQLYQDWNAKINVISRKDMDQFYVHHVLHSLAIAKVIKFKTETRVLDVGTGGGFPLIPLAIFFPNVKFLGVDSIGKKIKVVNAIVEALELKNVRAKHQRAEEVDGQFDFIVSRAVTRSKRFLTWVKNKVKPNSFNELNNGFLFLKGGELTEELMELKRKHEVFEISKFFSDTFFETKKVIYLPQ